MVMVVKGYKYVHKGFRRLTKALVTKAWLDSIQGYVSLLHLANFMPVEVPSRICILFLKRPN